jgi:hypothetical protein
MVARMRTVTKKATMKGTAGKPNQTKKPKTPTSAPLGVI